MKSKAPQLLDAARPELIIVFLMFAATGLLHRLGLHQTVLLNAFFLPVVLAGYFYGRTRAAATAVASIALVCWFALAIPGAFDTVGTSPAYKWLDLGIWGSLLLVIAVAVGHLYDNKQSAFADLRDAYNGVLELLSKFLDTADRYTEAHSVRVSLYATAVARRLGMTEQQVEDVRVASLLHDLGKVDSGIDLLKKVGSLTAEDWKSMRQHPAHGAWMVDRVGGILRNAVPLILYHHERVDGAGYYELAHADIPLGARIIAVADAYDAMTTDRPYRRALLAEEAKAHLQEAAGTQFDPVVVDEFVGALEDPNEHLDVLIDRSTNDLRDLVPKSHPDSHRLLALPGGRR